MLIGGCHPGDCHYQEGNYKALRRFKMLRKFLEQVYNTSGHKEDLKSLSDGEIIELAAWEGLGRDDLPGAERVRDDALPADGCAGNGRHPVRGA